MSSHPKAQSVFSQLLAHEPATIGYPRTRVILSILWIWIVLLQITTSNQTYGASPEEDALNKPNRPVPSKRISLTAAQLLRWSLVPLSLVYSSILGRGPCVAAVCIILATVIHHEGGGSDHWFTKNGCCAISYAAFEYGATSIIGET